MHLYEILENTLNLFLAYCYFFLTHACRMALPSQVICAISFLKNVTFRLKPTSVVLWSDITSFHCLSTNENKKFYNYLLISLCYIFSF